MKKFICLITALILFYSIFAPKNLINIVDAENLYARIITEDTPFYQTQQSESPLFFLPYTYYVKIIESGEKLTHVECYGDGNTATLDGFVPTEMLFYDGLEVQNPYVVLEITTVSTAILYQDSNLSVKSQYLFENRTLQYYGSLSTPNGRIFYVAYNDRLGYVKESDVFPFSIKNHPNELTFIKPTEPLDPPTEEPISEGFFGIKVAIIVALIFAGIIALIFIATNKKESSIAVSFYDDNDYE